MRDHDSFEAPGHNATWLTRFILHAKPQLKVMIVTDAAPDDSTYQMAEQAGASMVAKQGLDRQKFLTIINNMIPEE